MPYRVLSNVEIFLQYRKADVYISNSQYGDVLAIIGELENEGFEKDKDFALCYKDIWGNGSWLTPQNRVTVTSGGEVYAHVALPFNQYMFVWMNGNNPVKQILEGHVNFPNDFQVNELDWMDEVEELPTKNINRYKIPSYSGIAW